MNHPRILLTPKVLIKTYVLASVHSMIRQTLRQLTVAAISAAGIAILSGVGASPAHAIKCEDEFQITSRGLVATPFCEANYLAHVARSYGFRVSSRMLRRNPNQKREVCYFIGHDIRVQDICAGFQDSPFLPPW